MSEQCGDRKLTATIQIANPNNGTSNPVEVPPTFEADGTYNLGWTQGSMRCRLLYTDNFEMWYDGELIDATHWECNIAPATTGRAELSAHLYDDMEVEQDSDGPVYLDITAGPPGKGRAKKSLGAAPNPAQL